MVILHFAKRELESVLYVTAWLFCPLEALVNRPSHPAFIVFRTRLCL